MTDIIIEGSCISERIDVNAAPKCGCTINVPANCDHYCSK